MEGNPSSPRLSRRSALVAASVVGGVSLLAACGQTTTSPTAAPTTAAAPSPTTASNAATSPTAVASPAAASPTHAVSPTAATSPAASPSAATTPAAAGTTPSAVASPSAGSTPQAGGYTLPQEAPPLTARRLIDKPLPTAYFRPMGSVAEMRFNDLAGRPYGVPNSLFFVRDHVASVVVDAKTWKLSIEGDGVDKPYTLTYDELLKLPSQTITRYVECAGNGRAFFDTFLKKPAQGGQWRLGGWGVSTWTGVPLKELLDRAGLKKTAVQVMPIGMDQPRVRRPMSIAKALEADTMLVYGMNGGLLPIDHGFPARVLVPGWVGVNNIKWVGTIAVTTQPNWVDWNTNLYIMIGPDYKPEPPAKGPPVNEQVLKSAIALPWPASLKAGPNPITGYAWSPAGKIAKVEISSDNGKTWAEAKLIAPNIERAGVRWEFTYTAKPGDTSLMSRATDDKGNTQGTIAQQKWNQQGYLFGAAVPQPITVS